MEQEYEDIAVFHGHRCPGLAMGYRMTKAALAFLVEAGLANEEIMAITENKNCSVDALLRLSGCTFEKGNLIFKDHDKMVFTLYNRLSQKGVRVLLNIRNVPEDTRKDRDSFIDWLLSVPDEDVVSVEEVNVDETERETSTAE
ncbi:MAG TPA: formylmethanofuran dehydrogenase [Dehalococcoidia bacterium]|nr:formylmethanofuran dehydrogenase [Dehalococcoidia bacterium]